MYYLESLIVSDYNNSSPQSSTNSSATEMAGSWFWFSTPAGAATTSPASLKTPTPSSADTKSPNQNQSAPKVKPCCVCTTEKATRDECLLFTKSSSPEKECAPTIDAYKTCMKGFGFELP